MPHHERIRIEGHITDTFFHRFVIETTSGTKILADIGPKGADAFPLETGMHVVLEGEMKPSELKVERIARRGAAAVEIEHKKKHGPHGPGHPHPHADPDAAKRAVARAGFEPIGEPRRKPKHFEVLARRGRHLVECHVTLEGDIRREKPVEPNDEKWSFELKHAA